MSLVQFLRILWAHRFITLAATVSCLIGAYVVILIVPPRYETSSRVMLNLLKPDPVTGEFVGMGSRTYVATQIELIKDYRVAGQVVDQLGWQSDPNLIAQYRNRDPSDDRDFRRYLAQRVIDGTKAKLVSGSNILEITYTSNSPTTAKQIADAVRKAYMDSSLAARRDEATRNADWYALQAAKAKTALDAADATKTDYERANGIVMQDANNDLETARLRNLAGQAPLPPPAFVAPPPSPNAAALVQLDAQIAQQAQVLGANHPELIELRARRASLASLVAQESAAVRAQAAANASGVGILNRALEEQKTKVIAQRDKLQQLTQLQSDVNLRRDLYNRTMAKAAQFRQEAAAADTGIALLGNAVTPQKPSFPNKPLIMFGSLGLGAGMGILVGLLFELLSRRVRGVEDLQWAVDAPLLTVVSGPHKRRAATPKRRGRPASSLDNRKTAQA